MLMPLPPRITVIDSHTAGEPTRCVLADDFTLGQGSLAERLEVLRERYDHYRRAILCEPRGSEVLVGAYLLPPSDPSCVAAAIFFNNAGYLGMCGHGMIGVAITLAHLGRLQTGWHRIETPVGAVDVELRPGGQVLCRNVPSYRFRKDVSVSVERYGTIVGDIAWGGNWFFLVQEHGCRLDSQNVEALTEFTWAIRRALEREGITGAEDALIDHVELFTDAHDAANNSRNFVLCPGKVYDRSPCGTGTSAKMACLSAEGLLQPGESWRQEGILGTVFVGSYQPNCESGRIVPAIAGEASITAESTLLFDPSDPFRLGVPA